MSNKKILLISHNFFPEPIGTGKYNGEMIYWLANKGYDCTVITTFPYYPFWKVQPPYKNRWYKKEVVNFTESGARLTIYRCPSYIPKNPTGAHRVMQDFSYWLSKFLQIFKVILARKKFDLIITIAPPFHLAYLGLLIRNLNGGKLLYHIQDLQIEAARDLKLLSNQTVLKVLFKMERNILNHADFVSSISDGMIKRINTKVDRHIQLLPNWVNTTVFCPLQNRAQLKQQWGYNANDFVFLYSGAIGVKQGLDNVLEAAEALQQQKNIRFVICSSGPYKEALESEATKKNISNIKFVQLQPAEKFNEFLNMADVHLVMQKANAGDLMMPSKLATILASGGVSLVTAAQGTSLRNMVENFDIGYVLEPDRSDLLIEKIKAIVNDDSLELKREKARQYAVNYLNIDTLMNDFLDRFLR